jgi:hypothetical protein
MSKRVSDILVSLRDFSDEELEGLARSVNLIARERFRQVAVEKAAAFRPGDKVKNVKGSNRLPIGTDGTVERIGRSKVVVDFGIYRVWNVPAQWLQHVHSLAGAKA